MIKYPRRSTMRFCLISIFVSCIFIINACENNGAPPTLQSEIADGRLLSKKYCTSCHEYPDASLADKKSWVNGVLPAMGAQLHVQRYMGQYFCDKTSAISITDWQKIVTFYTSLGPDSLVIPKPAVAPLKDWAIFTLQKPAKVDASLPAMTTMISFDSVDHQLFTADADNNLYKWSKKLQSNLVQKFDSPVTGFDYMKGSSGAHMATVTCIGTMAPVNSFKGKVFLFNANVKSSKPKLITDSLPRPVQTVAADFNKDGLMDYAVCSFGHDRGGLYLVQQQPDHSFKKLVISSIAGGEQLIPGDFNNDGWPDLMCLFSQADEGIRMFLNDKKGGFTTQTLLRFPSIYGSSSFQLVDFNHDGKPDIIYTCGDNSDYSKILKPYHGVYIFLNQGNWKFKQAYFYHIDGCTKAVAADFDHDGDLDIACIAFFPDFKYHSQEGFTYFEQTSPGKFTAHEIPVNSYGRWLTMEVADIDQDGYDDIVLGNFSAAGRGLVNQPGYKPDWDMHEPIIILKNKGLKADVVKK